MKRGCSKLPTNKQLPGYDSHHRICDHRPCSRVVHMSPPAANSSSHSSVCVGIPCISAHLPWLPESLASVAESTLQPAMVVVALMGASASQCRAAAAILEKHSFRHELKCIEKLEPSGTARNLAARACQKHAEFISFLDADDLMFPYTLQRMVHLMQTKNASFGYHDYVRQDQPTVVRDDEELRAIAARTKEEVAARTNKRSPGKWNQWVGTPFHALPLDTHMGHVTVRSSEWFDQDTRHTREEDSRFAREAFLNPNVRIVHTSEKLTRYMKRGQPQTRARSHPHAAATHSPAAARSHSPAAARSHSPAAAVATRPGLVGSLFQRHRATPAGNGRAPHGPK